MTDDRTVHVTAGLLRVLLDFARDADPDPVTVSLIATPAGDWTDLQPGTPVFTDFYLPAAGRSIQNVFGVDLGTPGGSAGRFVSHPRGDLAISRTDDLAARVLVAVPPWERGEVAAFDRHGRRQTLSVVDAAPPERRLE